MSTISTKSTEQRSNRLYDRLKITAQVFLPAAGALYFALAQIWEWPHAEKVNGSIAALNLFVGVIVAWMKSVHDASAGAYDGRMTWEETEDGSRLRLTDLDMNALNNKDTIVIKIDQNRNPVAE